MKNFEPLLITTNKNYIKLWGKNNLQGEFSLSSQLSTLPRRTEVVLRPGDVSWEKYFPIISTTLSSSEKTGTPCPKSRAVVYTILILFCEAPVSPPNVRSVFSPCIVLVELSNSDWAARGFYTGGTAGCISWARARLGVTNRFNRESSWLVSHATYPGIAQR